ncbi:MAG: DUF4437 domain-containing protein [Cocleimonas sp.]
MKIKSLISKISLFGALSTLSLLIGINSVSADSVDEKSTLTSQTSAYKNKWAETPFGAFVSPVDGDMNKGKHITLIRFPAGLQTPVHTHTHDYTGIVITGVARHYEPGKKSTMSKLPAGSHWSISANTPHISQCFEGSGECIMAIVQEDKFDIHIEK